MLLYSPALLSWSAVELGQPRASLFSSWSKQPAHQLSACLSVLIGDSRDQAVAAARKATLLIMRGIGVVVTSQARAGHWRASGHWAVAGGVERDV